MQEAPQRHLPLVIQLQQQQTHLGDIFFVKLMCNVD